MLCRDVACDVQVQRIMYVGVTPCRHCQVDAHRVLFGRIICMCVLVWEDTSDRDQVDASRKTTYIHIIVVQHLVGGRAGYLEIFGDLPIPGIAAACNNATRAATITRFMYMRVS